MAASLRALRRRIRSTQSTKKIFSAQELIAGARIVRAQARVEASKPYAREITRVLSALASSASLDHPLLTERENPQRAAVLVITSDRGFAGSYNVKGNQALDYVRVRVLRVHLAFEQVWLEQYAPLVMTAVDLSYDGQRVSRPTKVSMSSTGAEP